MSYEPSFHAIKDTFRQMLIAESKSDKVKKITDAKQKKIDSREPKDSAKKTKAEVVSLIKDSMANIGGETDICKNALSTVYYLFLKMYDKETDVVDNDVLQKIEKLIETIKVDSQFTTSAILGNKMSELEKIAKEDEKE